MTVLVCVGWAISMIANLVFTYRLVPASLPIVGPAFSEYPEMSTAFAFFSPVTRSWEFLTGVLVLLAAKRISVRRRVAGALGWLGLAGIAFSYVALAENPDFPGVMALIPVAGAAAVLLAGFSEDPSAPTRALSLGPMRRVGDLSYSWYLWHWPLVVFAMIWFDSVLASTLAVIASYFLAIASYNFLERPIHTRRLFGTDKAIAVVAVLCIIVPFASGLALVRAWQHGWWRPEIQALQSTTTTPHLDTVKGCADISGIGPGSGTCEFEVSDAKGTILLVGDSNAGMYVEPARDAANGLGYSLEVATRNGCPIQRGGTAGTAACEAFVNDVLDGIADREPPYSLVIVVNAGRYAQSGEDFASLAPAGVDGSNPQGYAIAVDRALEAIQRTTPALLIYPIPQATGGDFPACIMPSVLTPSPNFACTQFDMDYLESTWRPTLASLQSTLDGAVASLDPSPMLCVGDASCSMVVGDQLAYRDDSHLSVDGSLLLTDELREAMRRGLAANGN